MDDPLKLRVKIGLLVPALNLAEQAIRFMVIDRQITLGTRSETGRRWYERI